MIWLDTVGAALALLGALVVLVAALGLLRMPDLFTRMHASGVIDTLGALTVFGGLTLVAGFTTETSRMLLILAFLWLTGTTGCHALSKSARAAGEQPRVAHEPSSSDPVPPPAARPEDAP